jgi:4-hydroxybenzoate polyprenyltransferase
MARGEGVSLFRAIRSWLEFVKFSHTIFALPFALASMALAARDNRGWPGLQKFLLILGAMAAARTAAMAFNRIVDRQFDARNPRTAQRHLPAGKISLISAVVLFAVAGSGLIVDAYFINPICFYLSPVALAIVCFYSLTKRFTDFTHVFLGVALALAPIGAWLAVKGSFDLFPTDNGWWSLKHSAVLPLLLAVAVMFWLIGFDIIYALQDYDFDRQHGLRSLVVRWGPKNALGAAFLAHMIMWITLMVFGLLAGFRLAYYLGGAFIIVCLVAEHWLARRRSLNWVNNAFFRLNAVISVVFLVATLTEICFPFFRMR